MDRRAGLVIVGSFDDSAALRRILVENGMPRDRVFTVGGAFWGMRFRNDELVVLDSYNTVRDEPDMVGWVGRLLLTFGPDDYPQAVARLRPR